MLDHSSPVNSDFGKRGRTPKYKFGRYGPHNNDAFEAAWTEDRSEGGTSATTNVMQKMLAKRDSNNLILWCKS